MNKGSKMIEKIESNIDLELEEINFSLAMESKTNWENGIYWTQSELQGLFDKSGSVLIYDYNINFDKHAKLNQCKNISIKYLRSKCFCDIKEVHIGLSEYFVEVTTCAILFSIVNHPCILKSLKTLIIKRTYQPTLDLFRSYFYKFSNLKMII